MGDPGEGEPRKRGTGRKSEPALVPFVDEAPRKAMAGGLRASAQLEELEIELLLEGIYRHYGADFRNYARASLRRRVAGVMMSEHVGNVTALLAKVLHDRECMERFLLALSVNVTSMFRDPSFFRTFREKIVPVLKSHPFVRIWHAGCSTGEEVYSMAILLEEEGLLPRCRLYATDMNEAVLKRAESGIFPLDLMQEYSANYLRAGGTQTLSGYYTAKYEHAIFKQSLKQNLVFSHHNLVTDGSFNEFNVVVCRNVMIYFDATLQERVHSLIFGSLRRFGILCLGRRESLLGTLHQFDYDALSESERIFRRRA